MVAPFGDDDNALSHTNSQQTEYDGDEAES